MKVSMNINNSIDIYTNSSKKTNEIKAQDKGHDKIEISNKGKEIKKYIDIAESYELKNNRVDEIKKLIDENKYSVDSSKLAKAMTEYMKNKNI